MAVANYAAQLCAARALEWMILLQMALAMGRFLLTSKNFARILQK
jgi:hypothetical protein